MVIEKAGTPEADQVIDLQTSVNLMQVRYSKDAAMIIARYINIFAFLWLTSFIFNCQNFVVAGTASRWFFSRAKGNLKYPILQSMKHLVRYHLGSISLGSLIVAIVRMIKVLIPENNVNSGNSCNFHCLIIGFLVFFFRTLRAISLQKFPLAFANVFYRSSRVC